MLRFPLLTVATLAAFMLAAPLAANAEARESPPRTAWFSEARFGLFIHFGLYAIPARGEWVRSVERITDEDYEAYFRSFNPAALDARAWARAAKAAGMKYAVLTAKHHDGFALFDSKLTDFKSTRTPWKRDLVREFVDAFRAEGLKVGLYYSLIDWHHADYPHYGDKHHPMREHPAWKDKKHDFERYLTFMHGQIRELVTQYGRIDLMWFDFSYDDMRGEKWKATELVRMVRNAQPHILLNNRLSGDGAVQGQSFGDFETPEQTIPETRPVDAQGNPVVWETCLTLNNHWGYHQADEEWKSPRQVVHALVNVVSKGGNLLLNVGPDARGRIPEGSLHVLAEVGKWMAKNGDSILGAGPVTIPELAAHKPDWGRFTQRGRTLYAHVLEPPIGHVNLIGIGSRVRTVRVLSDGREAAVSRQWWGQKPQQDGVWINWRAPTHHTYPAPDPWDSVLAVELD